MEAADQQMGAAGDDQGAREQANPGETMTDLCMEMNVCTHIEGQDPNGAAGLASGKGVGFVDWGDPAFKEAPVDPINGDVLVSVCMDKASKEHLLVDGDHTNGDQSTSACMQIDSSYGDKLTSVHTRKASKEASVGPHHFTSSTDMLNFFNQLLNGWPLNHDVNKYEHMMLEDLLKKGHPNFHEKIGTGIQAFQVRINKEFDNRCFYVIRKDGSMNDFSYRKCVDSILSLPKNLKSKFGRERNQKGPDSRENANAHVVGSKSQHSTRGRKRKHKGNGRHNLGGRGHMIQGRDNFSRDRRGDYTE